MCLLVLAWRCHPRYRLVVAANRDEYHARPAAPLAPWDDATGIVGGRDLQAGGAWFAVDGTRRLRHRHQLPRIRPAPAQRAFARRADPGLSGAADAARRVPAQPRNRCAGLRGLQPAARRPRFALVRVEPRRPVRARAPARHLRAVQRIPRHTLAQAGARAIALRGAARRHRSPPTGGAVRAHCSPCSRTARPRPRSLPAVGPVPRMGAQAVGAIRARSDLWHALFDRSDASSGDDALRHRRAPLRRRRPSDRRN